MHVLQIIVGEPDPKLVHVLYNKETRTATRIAIFEFDMNGENAQEIDYEEFPVLVKATLEIVQSYIRRVHEYQDIDKEIEGYE